MLEDPRLLPVYFAIDALDECEQGLPDLINLISVSLTISGKVRWLLSSRPSVKLSRPESMGTLLELDARSLDQPVRTYIDYKLSMLNGKDGYDRDTLAEISSIIYERANNTFLWAALIFQQLDSVEGSYALDIVNKMPAGLSELYGHMMTAIEKGRMRDPEFCKSVLAATCLAYRSLPLRTGHRGWLAA